MRQKKKRSEKEDKGRRGERRVSEKIGWSFRKESLILENATKTWGR